ncbi:MAG: FAD-dependent oxidoreductase [Deltaproteobacteria bacterium]|nr:FAD-dependent oxidoreductase [Deltaproteobacteria bacterium]MBN2672386.1 FAD-dependent oxidoreductase [Deltaproteobacteria bacterium]
MIFRLHGIRLRYNRDSIASLKTRILQHLSLKETELVSFSVVRRSIDARKKPVSLVYTVDCVTTENISHKDITPPEELKQLEVPVGKMPLPHAPVVVGAGPAGLFAAYMLAKSGYQPILLERGQAIEKRMAAIAEFARTRVPNPESNVLFGLGGAGTYSDGKLTTSLSHPIVGTILHTLVELGAPERILTDAKPHIGTDLLQGVVTNLAAKIEEMGGHLFTETKLTGLKHQNGKVVGVETSKRSFDTTQVVLAIGHSARDTWEMLEGTGVALAPKPFQVGVRVEHPQNWLDTLQYGEGAGHPALGAADYKVTARIDNVPVFSFCMCPGGHTIATVNEPNQLSVNGMSHHARNAPFSSSGIVVTLAPEVYGAVNTESALRFVRTLEKNCFERGGGDYTAPAQRLVDMVEGNRSTVLPKSSFAFGLTPTSLETLFPPFIYNPIVQALPIFNRRLPGFIHPESVAIAPEARASSPLRIVRDKDTRQSVSLAGLYPAGEGSGYAGGIMSAALDGINAALKIIEQYKPLQG